MGEKGAELAEARGASEGSRPVVASPGAADHSAEVPGGLPPIRLQPQPLPRLSTSGPGRICKALSSPRPPAYLQVWVFRSRFPRLRNAPPASPGCRGAGRACLSRPSGHTRRARPRPHPTLLPQPWPLSRPRPARAHLGIRPAASCHLCPGQCPLEATAGVWGSWPQPAQRQTHGGCYAARPKGTGTRPRAQCKWSLGKDPSQGPHPSPGVPCTP